AALSRRRLPRQLPPRVVALPPLELGQLAQRKARALGVGEPGGRRPHRPLHPASFDGRADRSQDRVLMAEINTASYDVVVVGAGGAGLRAAVEAHGDGAKTAVVCKSLLGKAHTVLAEGGIVGA